MFIDAISLGTSSTLSFDDTVQACRAALANEQFGILHEFDFQAAIVNKTGTDIGPYRVLAACHPASAADALGAVPSVGVLLPCNVAVYERDGHVVVKAVNPKPLMAAVDRDEVDAVAEDIFARLRRVVKSVDALSKTSAESA